MYPPDVCAQKSSLFFLHRDLFAVIRCSGTRRFARDRIFPIDLSMLHFKARGHIPLFATEFAGRSFTASYEHPAFLLGDFRYRFFIYTVY